MSDSEEDVVLTEDEGEDGHGTASNDKDPLCPLVQETIGPGLSLLCRTGNGLAHAYVKLDLGDKGLTDIDAIDKFIHIRYLDLSNNHITILSPLASLNQLLWLKIENNAVSSLKEQPLEQLTHLQWLSVARNKLTALESLHMPALESLNLTGNKIQSVSGLQCSLLANLVTLDLRGNFLETTDGIYLPNLRQLYLAQNVIKRLEGLEKLERLTTLHLRDNQLETLDGIKSNMKSLQYLNVRGNTIAAQNALQSLALVSSSLQALVLSENPVAETEAYRLDVLAFLPKLKRLDKDPVSPEEITDAQERIQEQLKKEDVSDSEDKE